MIEGIRAALDFPHDECRIRTVAFLTDGYIGNETEIFSEVNQRLGASRIFSFGVGSSTNRYLLNGLARVGRGAVAYLSLNDDAAAVMDAYFERVSHAALTDITIDWGSLQVSDVYPETLPDLVIGRPVVATGRFRNPSPTTITVFGSAAGRQVSIPVSVNAQRFDETNPGLPVVWAASKIADCAYRIITEPNVDWQTVIKNVALEYGLMSHYTAFVAVDSTHRTAGDHGTTVTVPVPVPKGVRYETTVTE
jgi:Ca-activated chloride channel family protein